MVTLRTVDAVWLRVDCEDHVARELNDYFTFETPGAQYMRRQARFRKWDGRIRLFKLKTRTIYHGLLPRVLEFCEQRGYEVDNQVAVDRPLMRGQDDRDLLLPFFDHLKLPFAPTDYQHTALREMLDMTRGIVLSPTGSGKSFIIYLLYKALGKKTLIVVPTVGLVSQMAKDFKEYGFDLSKMHTIQAGRAKEDPKARLFVSTWQSVYQMPPEYFDQFECIIVDEVHGAKAKSLTYLLEKAENTYYRFGLTGTLDDTQAHRLILEGHFGAPVRVATTTELIKKNKLAPLRVNMVLLKYPEAACKLVRKAYSQYQDEIEYIVMDRARMKFCCHLAKHLKGNALFLFNFVEKHGKPLYDAIQAFCPDKTVHYVSGEVEGELREDIREAVEEGHDQIIVASYGTFSTGINIRNLRHLVLASPSKSKIRVLQSIGRTLRMHEDKSHATLWDLCDDLRYKSHVNYAMKHGEQRAEYYSAERFPITIKEISLASFSTSPDVLASPPRNEDSDD